jgi:hypothetical protein
MSSNAFQRKLERDSCPKSRAGRKVAPRQFTEVLTDTWGSAMSKRVADLLVETLQAPGVKTCYGIVGDTMNRIAHAIDRSEIDWVDMRHEETGAFAAGAEASLRACSLTRMAVTDSLK